MRASVEPMCRRLADRMAEEGVYYLDAINNSNAVTPMIKEAMSGGRCKPGGLLGQILNEKRLRSGTK